MKSYVYFFQIDDLPQKPIKIGFTTRDVNLRYRELQRTMPFHNLVFLGKIAGDRSHETLLHNLFKESRILTKGLKSEWFVSNEFLERYISQYIKTSYNA